MYARKQADYTENTIYPYAELADLEPEILDKVRKRVSFLDKNHPWLAMEDMELLKSARLFSRDLREGKEGLTLAALLLFGKETTVLSAISHHRTDALVRRVNLDRYDDRDDIRTNLLDSYTRLTAFGEKHLPDPFHLEGGQRISLRSHILREMVGNLLIHREYTNPFPAKFIIEHGRILTENANKPHGHGRIDPASFSPFPKNPVIARLFKEIGLADELGSGVRNLYRYGTAYGGREPELLEDDIFRMIVAVPEDEEESSDSPPSPEKSSEKSSEKTSEKTSEKILALIRKSPSITVSAIASEMGLTTRAIEKQIAALKKDERIHRIGPPKGGHWEVLP
jgi:ATP-dependent DNA helicase RecG